jgi:Aerotolerance regulator N-terminal/von Willebrand factor type A domain
MSFLAPLYALGLLALSLPVIFHFIRRTPRGDFDFSTLMFLSPSPPRITRRSRLDNILLLILRGLVLTLLALAFARPFLQQTVLADASQADQRRVAILLDTSASMRRGNLWQQATAAVRQALADCRPYDEVAVLLGDESTRPLVSFEDMAQVAPAERNALVERRLRNVTPSWAATHLGQAVVDAVQLVSDIPAASRNGRRRAARIVVVSDLQEGSRLDVLAEHQWPADVDLELRQVRAAEIDNAGLHRLESRTTGASSAADSVRVRLSNDAASTTEQFQLVWRNDGGRAIGDALDVYVPAGESRVVRMPRATDKSVARRLELRGDDHTFDNTLYVADGAPAQRTIGYVGGDEADDPEGLRYYVERALAGIGPGVAFVTQRPSGGFKPESQDRMPLVIVAEPAEAQAGDLRDYLESGGTLLFVVTNPTQADTLAALLAAAPVSVEEANVDDYTMLGQIEFGHPLFAPMAGPQFNDFTQIHFWKYRQLESTALDDANVLARFENGDPALLEQRVGKGMLYVLTSGWHPSDSQLARSWKFVPLLATLARGPSALDQSRVQFQINEPLLLAERRQSAERITITKPDGSEIVLADGAQSFTATDQLGIYTIITPDRPQLFAVNLDPAESKTAPLELDTLEQLGVPLVNRPAAANNDHERQRLHDAQLESRQRIWQWLIAAALGLVVAETWLAGRLTRPSFTEASPA